MEKFTSNTRNMKLGKSQSYRINTILTPRLYRKLFEERYKIYGDIIDEIDTIWVVLNDTTPRIETF